MKVLSVSQLSIAFIVTALVGCSTMSGLHDRLADLQLQKKQLANGKTVYLDINVLPQPSWGCRMIDTPQYYNWDQIRMQGQFQWGGPYEILMQNALNYANQQNLNVNYINLGIPDQNTFSTGEGRLMMHHHLNADAMAVVSFYRCQQINPEHQLGAQKSTDLSVRVGG